MVHFYLSHLSLIYLVLIGDKASRYKRNLLELYSVTIPYLVLDYDSYNPDLPDI
jgi:hypothetical protein